MFNENITIIILYIYNVCVLKYNLCSLSSNYYPSNNVCVGYYYYID